MDKKYILKVDSPNCISCGMCVAMCSKLFAFNQEDKSYAVKNPENDQEVVCAKDAVSGCCVGVISLQEIPMMAPKDAKPTVEIDDEAELPKAA